MQSVIRGGDLWSDRTTIPATLYPMVGTAKPIRVVKIPSAGEKRERELRQLIRKGKKPVALLVDEAHDLHSSTLTGLKRLMEEVEDGGGILSMA